MSGVRPWQVTGADGRRVGGFRSGPDVGRRALFVHGVPASSVNVRFLDLAGTAFDEAGVACVAVDRPGIGFTSRHAELPTDPALGASAAADDMARVLDELRWPDATVIVHSAGAFAALTFAMRHADRVRRLVLIAAAPADLAAPEAAAMLPRSRAFFDLCAERPAGAAWMLRAMRLGMLVAPGPATRAAAAELPAPDRALMDDGRARAAFVAMLRHGLRRGPHGMVIDGLVVRGPWPLTPSDVRCPVDVYAGDEDRNVPASVARAWAERLEGARLTPVAGEGHVSILAAVAERVLATVD